MQHWFNLRLRNIRRGQTREPTHDETFTFIDTMHEKPN